MSDSELGEGKTCFVICPIGDRLAAYGTPERTRYEASLQMWENVFDPVCSAFSLNYVRADKIAESGEITDQVVGLLATADLVIADLSGGNANVMYELGMRHTRDLPTVLIGEYAKLPFDVQNIRTIQFRRSEGGLVEARDELIRHVRSALEGKGTPVGATRAWNSPASKASSDVSVAAEKSRQPDEPEDHEGPGFLDILADGEEAVTAMNLTMSAAGASVQEIGDITKVKVEEVTASDAKGAGFAGRVRVMRALAAELSAPSANIESASADLEGQVTQVDAMVRYLFEQGALDDEEEAALRTFGTSILNLCDVSEETIGTTTTLLGSARNLRKISKDLATVSRAQSVGLSRMIESMGRIVAWRELVIGRLGGDPRTE